MFKFTSLFNILQIFMHINKVWSFKQEFNSLHNYYTRFTYHEYKLLFRHFIGFLFLLIPAAVVLSHVNQGECKLVCTSYFLLLMLLTVVHSLNYNQLSTYFRWYNFNMLFTYVIIFHFYSFSKCQFFQFVNVFMNFQDFIAFI